MKKYTAFIICLLTFALSCADEPDNNRQAASIETKTPTVRQKSHTESKSAAAEQTVVIEQNNILEEFFNKCKLDLDRAAEVVETKDVVFSLSHLQIMDSGGDKFYLLERENISEMINAVIQKIYSDYILINQDGTVIYTKINNTIFSKNVKRHLHSKILRECFENTSYSVFVSDISQFNSLSNNDVLLFSKKVKGSDGFSGTLILQLNTDQVQKILNDTEFIIGASDGKYRIAKEKMKIHSSYEFFSLIDKSSLSADQNTMLIPEKGVSGRVFNYSTLSWIVLQNKTSLN